MDRFVTPLTVRLPISQGDFIDIKRRLNTGEQQDLFAQMMPTINPGQPYALQSRHVLTAKVLAYLVGWSLTRDDKPVPVSPDAVNNLDPDTFREIREAIDAHEQAVDAELEVAKKNRDIENISRPASTSVGA